MNQKVIFLDIDGTMVNSDGRIPDTTKEAIARAKSNGHKMVICSGRSRFQMYDELIQMGFSGIVGAAGAFVEADGEEIYHAYIDEEHCKSSYEYLERNGFCFCYQADEGIVINKRCREEMFEAFCNMGMDEIQLQRLMGKLHLTDEPWKNKTNEKIIYQRAPFHVEKVHADLEPYFDTVAMSLDGMDDYAGEIGINGINKSTGMEIYLKHVGIGREDSIALGDGPNDLQMMEYAGIGVAMGNAREDVKQRADMVTDAIGEDGLYHAFERLGLI